MEGTALSAERHLRIYRYIYPTSHPLLDAGTSSITDSTIFVLKMLSLEFTGGQLENRLSTVFAGLSLTSL